MKSTAPHKLHNIQSLRGIAALLVLLSHLPSMELKHGGDVILPSIVRFGVSGVDLFFVISGFVMVYVTWNSERTVRSSLKFIFARVTRIYPIYWLIAGLVIAAWMVKPGLISFDAENASLVKSFLLWPDQYFPMLKVAWTLIHELYFYIVFAFLLLLPKRFLLPGLFVWVFGVTVGNLLGMAALSPETALIFHPLGVEFFMGALAAWLFKVSHGAAGRLSLLAGLILAAVSLYFLSAALGDQLYPSNWERVLYFGLPAILIVYGMAASELGGLQLPRWTSRFGDWSYSLYLSHILSLSVLGYLWRPFAKQGPLDNIIALVIMTVGSVAVSALLWYMFEKPVLNIFRKLRSRLFPSG